MARSARNFDWMVTLEGYQTLDNDSIVANSIAVYPLTYSSGAEAAVSAAAEGSRILGTFEAGDNWTLEAVVGEVYWTVAAGTDTNSWRAVLGARLEVFQAASDGAPMIALDYSLESPIYANRQFLWQSWWTSWKWNAWWDDYQIRGPLSGKFNIRTQSKRRIQTPDEVVCLVVQWAEDENYADGPIPRLHLNTALRVLGSKNM